jgi:hypothetical protein
VDPRLGKPRVLGHTKVGDEQHVARGLDLGLARVAAPADLVLRVAPFDGGCRGQPRTDDRVQPPPSPPIHGRDVGDIVGADAAVAEDQLDGLARGDAEALELFGIGGELEERSDAGAPRKLCVLHDIAAVRAADYEVGEAEEGDLDPIDGDTPLVEGRLEHHIDAGPERLERGERRGIQLLWRAGVDPRDLDDAETRLIGGEHPLLVLVAERAGALEHGVGRDIQSPKPDPDERRAPARTRTSHFDALVRSSGARVDDGVAVIRLDQEHPHPLPTPARRLGEG